MKLRLEGAAVGKWPANNHSMTERSVLDMRLQNIAPHSQASWCVSTNPARPFHEIREKLETRQVEKRILKDRGKNIEG